MQLHVYHHHDHSLKLTLEAIMSAITDYNAKVKIAFDSINADLDVIKVEIQGLNDKITALQNSSGSITPEDQALLDALQAQSDALVQKADALKPTIPVPQVG